MFIFWSWQNVVWDKWVTCFAISTISDQKLTVRLICEICTFVHEKLFFALIWAWIIDCWYYSVVLIKIKYLLLINVIFFKLLRICDLRNRDFWLSNTHFWLSRSVRISGLVWGLLWDRFGDFFTDLNSIISLPII